MTIKQKLFIKEYIKTKNAKQAVKNVYNPKTDRVAEVMASENLRKPEIKNELERLLVKHELTADNALVPVAKALRAKKVVAVEGDFYETEVDDLPLQLQASDRILKLLGAYKEGGGTNLHLHLHKSAGDLDI